MSITGPQSVTSSASLIDSFPDFVAEMASHYVFETNFLGRRFMVKRLVLLKLLLLILTDFKGNTS